MQTNFAYSINCLYYELFCQRNEAFYVSYRAELKFGAGTKTNVGFEVCVIEVCVIYGTNLSQNSDMDNLKVAMTTDVITVLQKELAVKQGIN